MNKQDYYLTLYEMSGDFAVPPKPERTVSTGEWILTILLSGIPAFNIIFFIFWMVSGRGKKSKRSYAAAMLILFIIAVNLVAAGVILLYTVFNMAFGDIIKQLGLPI